jgi:hypothetical protein
LQDSYPRTWSFATIGENLIANPRLKGIYRWQNQVGTPAELLPNAPANCTFVMVTQQRQIHAFGCQQQYSNDGLSSPGPFNPMCIRGSDIDGNVETWDATAANNAYEYILEAGSRIVAAAKFGPGMLVWTDTAIYQATFQDNPAAPWFFELVANECGLIAPNAVTVVNQVAYWLSPSLQFYMFVPGMLPQIVPCRIRKDFTDYLDRSQIDKIACTNVGKYGEVWWFYPDARDGDECSRFLLMSGPDLWSKGTLARSAVGDFTGDRPVMVSPDGISYRHEDGTTADGEDIAWRVQVSGQSFGERRAMVRTVFPDFEDQAGDIEMTLQVQDYPQATPRDKGPYTLARGREKRDLRVEGAIIGATFRGSEYARMGRPAFEITGTGRR